MKYHASHYIHPRSRTGSVGVKYAYLLAAPSCNERSRSVRRDESGGSSVVRRRREIDRTSFVRPGEIESVITRNGATDVLRFRFRITIPINHERHQSPVIARRLYEMTVLPVFYASYAINHSSRCRPTLLHVDLMVIGLTTTVFTIKLCLRRLRRLRRDRVVSRIYIGAASPDVWYFAKRFFRFLSIIVIEKFKNGNVYE